MGHGIPSSGASWVISELMWTHGKVLGMYGNVGGMLLGLAGNQANATAPAAKYAGDLSPIVQLFANQLDTAIDVLKEGLTTAGTARSGLVLKGALGCYQGSKDNNTVFLAACAALALDGALCIAFPPAGIGMVFCALGLMIDCAGVATGFNGLPRLSAHDVEALTRQQIFMQRCRVVLPTKSFYNWQIDYRDPGRFFSLSR